MKYIQPSENLIFYFIFVYNTLFIYPGLSNVLHIEDAPDDFYKIY